MFLVGPCGLTGCDGLQSGARSCEARGSNGVSSVSTWCFTCHASVFGWWSGCKAKRRSEEEILFFLNMAYL